MSIITELNKFATDPKQLEIFVANNYGTLYDFFIWSTDEDLSRSKSEIRDFVTRNRITLLALPVHNTVNLNFLAILCDASERLGLLNSFIYLYTFLKKIHYEIGSRLDAAAKYLIQIKEGTLLAQQYNSIYELLQISYLNEEDNADKVLTTIINYYSKAILDFGQFNIEIAKVIRTGIQETIKNEPYSFLNHPLIAQILDIDLADFEKAHDEIRRLLDHFLRRGPTKGKEFGGYIVEDGSVYANNLAKTDANFAAIRGLSVSEYNKFGSPAIFDSLRRGVTVLEKEIQLFAYFHSLGKMHHEKLMDAFQYLPPKLYTKRVNIIDWGCGQAMAAMCFLEYCQANKYHLQIEKITLIEPSELALKRGSLHVEKFVGKENIATIPKVLDNVTISDIQTKAGIILHLFSNILDIDLFSITNLARLIKKGCNGNNYFVIVSPYISSSKTEKINSFLNSFSSLKNYKLLYSIDQEKGKWINGWSRVIRIFYVELNYSD